MDAREEDFARIMEWNGRLRLLAQLQSSYAECLQEHGFDPEQAFQLVRDWSGRAWDWTVQEPMPLHPFLPGMDIPGVTVISEATPIDPRLADGTRSGDEIPGGLIPGSYLIAPDADSQSETMAGEGAQQHPTPPTADLPDPPEWNGEVLTIEQLWQARSGRQSDHRARRRPEPGSGADAFGEAA